MFLIRASAPLFFLVLACNGDGGQADAGDGGETVCGVPFIGERGKDIEIELVALGEKPPQVPIKDGDVVPLIFPPQGGRVLFIGARARNLDPCGVRLAGVIRDVDSRQVRLDVRTVNLQKTPDGWGTSSDSDISSFANVPVCPNQWANGDAYGRVYELSVNVTDRTGRRVEKTIKATLDCAEPSNRAECLCICKANYVLGQACP